jgi:hypothetical protein
MKIKHEFHRDLIEFHKACNGVVEWAIFGPRRPYNVFDQLTKAKRGDASASAKFLALTDLLKRAKTDHEGSGTRCLRCDDHEFHAKAAGPLCIVVFSNVTQAIASGVCGPCARRGDLEDVVGEMVQKILMEETR